MDRQFIDEKIDINFIPPFVDVDRNSGTYNEIKPLALSPKIMHPEDFDDNWADELIEEDRLAIKKYFSEDTCLLRRQSLNISVQLIKI